MAIATTKKVTGIVSVYSDVSNCSVAARNLLVLEIVEGTGMHQASTCLVAHV